MKEAQLNNEDNLYKLRKHIFQNSVSIALGVAYFDFIFGLVGIINGVLHMIRMKSFYPFFLPDGLEDDMAGPFSRRFLYIGLYIAVAALLTCSIFLFFGIISRQICLINLWYFPNAIFVIVHAVTVVTLSFYEVWDFVAMVSSLLALRIFAIIEIYQFQKTLLFHKFEKKLLRERCGQNLEYGDLPLINTRQIQLHKHHKVAIAKETKAVAGAVFANIDGTSRNEGELNDVGMTPENGCCPGARNLDHELYNSLIYSSYKLRQETYTGV